LASSRNSRLCLAALATLKEAGAVLVHADLPGIAALNEAESVVVSLYEMRRDLDKYIEKEGLGLRFPDIVQSVESPDVAGISGDRPAVCSSHSPMSTTPSGNHESPKSKIPKRKKARSNSQLSGKIEYYIKTNSARFSDQSAFFTDDLFALCLAAFFSRFFFGFRGCGFVCREVCTTF
jgi:hypothetical protein